MNLIVGATGSLGSRICRELAERGQSVRALVRSTSDPAKLQELRSLGAHVVYGDLTDAASLRTACEGVDVVVSSATVIKSAEPTFSAVDDAGQRALVDAARARDVGQLVFVSVSGNINLSCPLIDAKRSVEAYLIQSGVSYTILRYSAFFETWLGPLAGFDHVNHTATVLGNGQQRLSYISEADAARFAAACGGRAGARNRTIELGGPDAITPHEAIAVFERVSGTRYTVQNISLDALQAQYAAAEHPTQKSFAALMLALASDDVIPMAATAAEFGITPRPLADVAHELVPISAH